MTDTQAKNKYSGMAELADAPDLGSVTTVVLSAAVGQVKKRQELNMQVQQNRQTPRI